MRENPSNAHHLLRPRYASRLPSWLLPSFCASLTRRLSPENNLLRQQRALSLFAPKFLGSLTFIF